MRELAASAIGAASRVLRRILTMTESQKVWAQVIAGFAILVLGIFLTRGITEIALAVLGVYMAAQGLQKLRQL